MKQLGGNCMSTTNSFDDDDDDDAIILLKNGKCKSSTNSLNIVRSQIKSHDFEIGSFLKLICRLANRLMSDMLVVTSMRAKHLSSLC